jgi:hypothetical protein
MGHLIRKLKHKVGQRRKVRTTQTVEHLGQIEVYGCRNLMQRMGGKGRICNDINKLGSPWVYFTLRSIEARNSLSQTPWIDLPFPPWARILGVSKS